MGNIYLKQHILNIDTELCIIDNNTVKMKILHIITDADNIPDAKLFFQYSKCNSTHGKFLLYILKNILQYLYNIKKEN